jgi:hypothetical protein
LLAQEIIDLDEEIEELKEQLSLSIVTLEIDTEDAYQELYSTIEKSFQFLQTSSKKWDFTSSKLNNMIAERTSAAHSVTRSAIEILFKNLPIINCERPAMCFHNMNGGDIYFYPGFIIVYENKQQFALLSYTEVEMIFKRQRFIEEEAVPVDAHVVGKTWLKVNKDGSPDRRFAYNREIPIAEYGQIALTSDSGLNELYCFSNLEYATMFAKAYNEYASSLRTSDAMLKEFKS